MGQGSPVLQGSAAGQGGFGGKQQQAAAFSLSPRFEAREIEMAREGGHFEIVHARTPQGAVGEIEAGRLDEIDGNAKAGGHAQDRAIDQLLLLTTLQATQPLSVVMAEQLAALRDWARGRTVSADEEHAGN